MSHGSESGKLRVSVDLKFKTRIINFLSDTAPSPPPETTPPTRVLGEITNQKSISTTQTYQPVILNQSYPVVNLKQPIIWSISNPAEHSNNNVEQATPQAVPIRIIRSLNEIPHLIPCGNTVQPGIISSVISQPPPKEEKPFDEMYAANDENTITHESGSPHESESPIYSKSVVDYHHDYDYQTTPTQSPPQEHYETPPPQPQTTSQYDETLINDSYAQPEEPEIPELPKIELTPISTLVKVSSNYFSSIKMFLVGSSRAGLYRS